MVRKATVWAVMVFIVLGFGVVIAGAMEVPKISKEKLKAMLGNPDVVVIDVRTLWDRNMSVKQIKGALREDPADVKSWAKQVPQEKTIVVYCA
jgi:rhodanese-related sulfurtransferase